MDGIDRTRIPEVLDGMASCTALHAIADAAHPHARATTSTAKNATSAATAESTTTTHSKFPFINDPVCKRATGKPDPSATKNATEGCIPTPVSSGSKS